MTRARSRGSSACSAGAVWLAALLLGCGGKTEGASSAAPERASTSPSSVGTTSTSVASTTFAPGVVSSTPPSSTSPSSSTPSSTSPSSTPPHPTTVSFAVHAEARDQPHCSIDKVTIGPKETTVEVTFENRTPKSRVISVDPTGPEALFIESAGKRYAFLRSVNIARAPLKNTVKPKEKRSFTLVFEPLPVETASFDLFEGEGAKKAPQGKAKLWAFVDVRLVPAVAP